MPRASKPSWVQANGCWRFRYQGRVHWAKLGGPDDWSGAARWADQIRSQVARVESLGTSPTVFEVCDWFLWWHSRHGSSPRTREQYRAVLTHWCRLVGADRKAADIQPIDLARAERWFEAKGQQSTRWHLVKVVLACWAWAARPEPDRDTPDGLRLPDRLLERNTLEGYRRPRAPRGKRQAGERWHVAAVIRAARSGMQDWAMGTQGRCVTCTRHHRAGPCRRSHDPTRQHHRDTLLLLRVLAATGARPGELAGAKWENWEPAAGRDDRGHWWGVLRVAHKTQRHTGDLRAIVVPPVLTRAIERMRVRPGRHEVYLWTHRRGKGSGHVGSVTAGTPWTVTALGRRVREWRSRAKGVPEGWSLYWMRHGWYTRNAPRLGAEVAGLLGGTGAQVIRRVYLHADVGTMVREAARNR